MKRALDGDEPAATAKGDGAADEPFPLERLPKEIVEKIVFFVCGAGNLAALSQCSTRFRKLCDDPVLWKNELRRTMALSPFKILTVTALLNQPDLWMSCKAALLQGEWFETLDAALEKPPASVVVYVGSGQHSCMRVANLEKQHFEDVPVIITGSTAIVGVERDVTFRCMGGPGLVLATTATCIVCGINFVFEEAAAPHGPLGPACCVLVPAMLGSDTDSKMLLLSECSFTCAQGAAWEEIVGVLFESKCDMPQMRNYLMGYINTDNAAALTLVPDLAKHGSIINCTFTRLRHGIIVTTADGSIPETPQGFSFDVQGCTFSHCSGAGVVQRCYGAVQFLRCRFSQMSAGGVALRLTNLCQFFECVFEECGGKPAVYLEQIGSVHLVNCQITGGMEGVVLDTVHRATLHQLEVAGCHTAGLIVCVLGGEEGDEDDLAEEREPFPEYFDEAYMARGLVENAVAQKVSGVQASDVEQFELLEFMHGDDNNLSVRRPDGTTFVIAAGALELPDLTEIKFEKQVPSSFDAGPLGVHVTSCVFRNCKMSNASVEVDGDVDFTDCSFLSSQAVGLSVSVPVVPAAESKVKVLSTGTLLERCNLERNALAATVFDGAQLNMLSCVVGSNASCGIRCMAGGKLAMGREMKFFGNGAGDLLLLCRMGEQVPEAKQAFANQFRELYSARVEVLHEKHKSMVETDFESREAFIAAVLAESVSTSTCTRFWTGLRFYPQPSFECYTCNLTTEANAGICSVCRKDHISQGHKVSPNPVEPMQDCFCDCLCNLYSH